MSEPISDDYSQDSDKVASTTNTELIYAYTEELIKAQSESLNRLDTKLSGFLAFSGLLIKFAADLPDGTVLQEAIGLLCYTCILLKTLTFILLTVASIFLCLGLTARIKGGVVSPRALMRDEWLYATRDVCQSYIINTWLEAEQEYKQLGFEKSRKLN